MIIEYYEYYIYYHTLEWYIIYIIRFYDYWSLVDSMIIVSPYLYARDKDTINQIMQLQYN